MVDVKQNTGYSLSTRQTEAGLSHSEGSSPKDSSFRGNLIDFCLGHLAYCQNYFPTSLNYNIDSDGARLKGLEKSNFESSQ